MKRKTIITNAFTNHTEGLLFFTPNRGNFVEGKPIKGFGSIKYKSDGSIYTGDLYYDGKRFNKIGYGQQDFSECRHGYFEMFGKKHRYTLYVGKFDYRKTDWIYGNGVLYFRDEIGNPSGFIKGFFVGLSKKRDWKDFDYSNLAFGYTKEMELPNMIMEDYNYKFDFYNNSYNPNDKFKLLFLGDSYFEFLKDVNYSGFEMKNELNVPFLNLAVGGTQYCHWLNYIPKIKLTRNPEYIFLNLGFNDIHAGTSVKTIEKQAINALDMLKVKFPASKIILFNICHSPNFVSLRKYEDELNDFLYLNQEKYSYTLLDISSKMENLGISGYNEDRIHPSPLGYKLYFEFLKKLANS